jgi:hypothetical protein
VGDRDNGAFVFLQEAFEPGDRLGVEVIRRFVKQQEIRRLEKQSAERNAAALATRQLRHLRVRRWTTQGVHRQLELRIDVPCVHRVNAILQSPLLFEELVHRFGRHVLGKLHVELVVPIEQSLDFRDTLLDVPFHVLRCVETWLLWEESDADPVSGKRLADEFVILAGHDLQQRALAGTVQPEDADLRAGQK